MNCKKCGNVLLPTDVFCRNCGEPVSANNVPNQNVDNTLPNQTLNNTMPSGVASMPTPTEAPVSTPQGFVTGESVNPAPAVPEPSAIPVPPQPVAPATPEPMSVAPVEPILSTAPVVEQPQPVASQPVTPQPVMQPQQPMPADGAGVPTEEKKKSPVFTIVVVVLLVVILLLGAFLVYKKFFANPVDNGSNTTNQGSGTEVVAAQTFTFKGFTYTLPAGYLFNTAVVKGANDDDVVVGYIMNGQGSIISGFNVYNDSIVRAYTRINASLDKWKADYASVGYTLQNVELHNVNGTEWLLLTLLDSDQTVCYDTYAPFGSSYIISGNIESLGSTTLDSVLNVLDNMHKTATYNGSTSFAAGSESPADADIAGEVDAGQPIAFAAPSVNEQ